MNPHGGQRSRDVASAKPAPSTAQERPGIDRVILCLDRSELGERGLPHAKLLARAFGVPLILLHVLDARDDSVAWDAYQWEILREESGAYLEHIKKDLGEDVEHVEVRLVEGKVEDQLLQEIGIGCTQLVVLSTHGERGMHGWHMGRTVRQILAAAPSSLLLVPAWQEPMKAGEGYHRIAVPLDGSPRAECALPCAVQIARVCGAELLLVHVVPHAHLTHFEAPLPGDRKLVQQLDERNAEVAQRYLEHMQRRAHDHVRVRTLIRRGTDVRDVLIELREHESVDMIVMSAHGRTGSDRRPYGSVAAHLIEHGETPLLLIQDLPAEARSRMAAAFHKRQQPVRQAILFHDETR